MDNIYLFDGDLLKDIDYSKGKCNIQELYDISASNPGEDLCMRPLSTYDYDKGKISSLCTRAELLNARFIALILDLD